MNQYGKPATFPRLETDLHRSSTQGVGDQPRRGCQFRPTATAHLQRWCAGAGETLHRLLRCSPQCRRSDQCSRSDRHHQKANAASTGTLDKQESHRIRCVHNDAGGFPERSTQPMVGSRNVRRTCRHRINGVARGSNSARKPRSAGKRSQLTSTTILAYFRPHRPSFSEKSQSLHGVYPWGAPSPSHNRQKASARTLLPYDSQV